MGRTATKATEELIPSCFQNEPNAPHHEPEIRSPTRCDGASAFASGSGATAPKRSEGGTARRGGIGLFDGRFQWLEPELSSDAAAGGRLVVPPGPAHPRPPSVSVSGGRRAHARPARSRRHVQ